MKTLKIGSVELPNPVILAPMAGVSDLPFRMLCREQGAGLVCMEMVSAKAIAYHNRNTEKLMETDEREHPVSLQLFGSEPDLMAEIAAQIEERPFDILDINMGCPVPKIVGNGEGSALMKNPKLIEEIITKVSRAVKKPLTVKFRKGFDDDHVNAVEIARIAEASGAAAVAEAKSTAMPALPSLSITWSSHSNVNAPSTGSILSQLKIASDTTFTPASPMRRISSSSVSSGHWSGL